MWVKVSVFILAVLIGAFWLRPLPAPDFDEAAWRQGVTQSPPQALYAPHQRDTRFFNPWRKDDHDFLSFLHWRLTRPDPSQLSGSPTAVMSNTGVYLKQSDARPSITWIGHASFAIQSGGQVWITDPMFSQRAVLPKRITPPGIPLRAIPENALALISHNHYDHMDMDSIRAMPASTRWFVPLGLKSYLHKHGIENVQELDWWQSVQVGDSTLVCLPAQHWSNRIDMARNASLWASWLIINKHGKVYFGGDSGYFPGFAEIRRRFGPIDDAILPIGAYQPRWFMAYAHMDIAEALQAFKDLGARRMIPMQFGAFALGDEAPDAPLWALRQQLSADPGLAARVHIAAVGERILLD